MKTLKLKQETFFRTFSIVIDDRIGAQPPELQYVQPHDGILNGYDLVEVTQTTVVGREWERAPIEIITTYDVQKWDDLSLIMVPIRVHIPVVDLKIEKPLIG